MPPSSCTFDIARLADQTADEGPVAPLATSPRTTLQYRITQFSFRQGPPVSSPACSLPVTGTSPDEVMEQVFAAWNNGSGRECPDFRAANRHPDKAQRIHSLSSGDVVSVSEDGGQTFTVHHLCRPWSWERISEEELAIHASRMLETGGHRGLPPKNTDDL